MSDPNLNALAANIAVDRLHKAADERRRAKQVRRQTRNDRKAARRVDN